MVARASEAGVAQSDGRRSSLPKLIGLAADIAPFRSLPAVLAESAARARHE